MLASQVTSLTRLRRLDLARVQLAAVGGVQVRHRGGAVAIGGHGEFVDMVGCGAWKSVLCCGQGEQRI